MKNYSYMTLLSDDSYIYGIILLQKSLQEVNTEYPLEVIVTPNVSKPVLNILEQLNLKYRIIEAIKVDSFIEYNSKVNAIFARTWALTFTKFKIFSFTEFDKIIFLDADIMVLKNIDHLFEKPHLTAALDGEYFNIWPDEPHLNAGLLVIEPNIEEYNKIIDFMKTISWNKNSCIADQEVLNLYYSDWPKQTSLHLNKYYNIFAPYVQEDQVEDILKNSYFIHFIGRKPWKAFYKSSKETYSEVLYDLAHKKIQDEVNLLDWEKAKNEIKLAVYAICKDEIIKVKDYVKCFSQADYLCILDTGSTDGTWEFLQEARKSYSNLIIQQEIITPWRYDTARNLSLKLVPNDTTMYFMVDLDEIIKEDGWVDSIKNAWNPLFLRGSYTYNRQVDPATDSVLQCFLEFRVHNNSWHYNGLVHEQLCNVANSRQFFEDECINIPITVWHYPTHPNRETYIELCEQQVKEEPLNWLIHLQLAAEYEVHFKYEQAIKEYRRILAESSGLADVEIGRCFASLGKCLYQMGEIEEGLAVLNKGISLLPNVGDLYFFCGEIYYRINKFQEAIDYCEKGLINAGQNQWCTIVRQGSYFPYLILGVCNFELGNRILGLGYMTIAKEKNNNKEVSNIYNQMLNNILNGR